MSVATEAVVWDTVERYFALLQAHADAQDMLADILTPDFRTGFPDGQMWEGPDGLRAFLEARSVFFDERHTIQQMSEPVRGADGRWSCRTRLSFFLRRVTAGDAVSQEFTGLAWHTWVLEPGPSWRVAAQLVDGFADLNDNARALFARPDEGLQT
ncbi:nuclear transport factor 2 family protein [Streptomyces sp. ODS05-4]|uniref:nuclear transport factor 2 family protein n=1 Tax=Streptomyces sp. ODS05-4 TaxID=2944939 RepID=UPI002108766E|nr:nuclear transport factor 2 family protein [Streptomyces sp. ODS05-4]